MKSATRMVRAGLVIGLLSMLYGCVTTGAPEDKRPDDLNRWMQQELNKRGVFSSPSASAAPLQGV